MIKEGQTLEICQGFLKGYKGIVKKLHSKITIEVELFGRKTEMDLSYSEFGLIYQPQYLSFESLLSEFDNLYKAKAPLRYACLNDGVNCEAFASIETLLSIPIPADFRALFQWKNGLNSPQKGWKNEFENDSWYELIPINSTDHFMNLKLIEDTILLWQDMTNNVMNNNLLCYWKKGFIPFLMIQNFGLVVVDTIGYFNGQPGQIISFDYKCGNGYSIIHENLNKWLETQVALIKNGLLFSNQNVIASTKIKMQINDYYTCKFNTNIPLNLDKN